MKRMLRRSTFILIFTLAFIIGISSFTVELVANANKWVDQPYNDHIYVKGGLQEAGEIFDRNGTSLAKTVDKKRVYNSDESIRKSLLHTVGDDSMNISTAVQSKLRSTLTGYSFIWGMNMPESARYSRDITLTVDADTCKAAYDVLTSGFEEPKRGACVIYNYKTGEILVCASIPSIDVTKGYADIANFETGTLISKAMYGTVPGSTQKVSTVIAAMEALGRDNLLAKSYNCTGRYLNANGDYIDCHNVLGHGTLNLQQAVENSCNPYFAQLVADPDLPLENIIQGYRRMGYAVNDDKEKYINIDGIICEKASTNPQVLFSS